MPLTKKSKIGMDLTEGSIFRLLLVFALPIALTNIIQQFYSMVDLIVIGQFVGNVGTAGVSSGGELADMAAPIAMAFDSAGQIIIAQQIGSKRKEDIQKSMGTLMTLMFLMSLVFMVITIGFCKPLLRLINCPEEAFVPASNYMRITALGLPFVFGYNAICGSLRGMGESRWPMIFICVAATINIFLDILLIAVIPWGAAGCAISTVFAQMGSCGAAFFFMLKHKEQFHFELKWSFFKIDPYSAKIILQQGLPIAIRSFLVRISLLWVNSQINMYGVVATATNGIGNKLQKFLDVFYNGLNQASSAMVGQNLGAKRQDRAAKVVWCSLTSTLCIAVLLSLLAIFLPREIIGIFTSESDVLTLGVAYMHMLIAHFFCSAVVTSFQSMVVGCGFASMNFAIGILDGVVCKVGLSLLFANVMGMGLMGYFWAIGFSRALPGIICFIFFLSGKWRTRKLVTERK